MTSIQDVEAAKARSIGFWHGVVIGIIITLIFVLPFAFQQRSDGLSEGRTKTYSLLNGITSCGNISVMIPTINKTCVSFWYKEQWLPYAYEFNLPLGLVTDEVKESVLP